MKTRFLIATLLLTLAFGAICQASSIKEKEVKDISNYLNRTIKYPVFAENKNIEGSVSLIVWVDENQKLQYSNIQGNDARFEKYVETWFKKMEQKPVKFDKNLGAKKVKIDFKLIN